MNALFLTTAHKNACHSHPPALNTSSSTGCGSAWLERSVRDAEAGGSNPLIPTRMVEGLVVTTTSPFSFGRCPAGRCTRAQDLTRRNSRLAPNPKREAPNDLQSLGDSFSGCSVRARRLTRQRSQIDTCARRHERVAKTSFSWHQGNVGMEHPFPVATHERLIWSHSTARRMAAGPSNAGHAATHGAFSSHSSTPPTPPKPPCT